ncbi:exoribonuclease 1 [Annulohypoxylon maeteangense]|uniref:exoribonuclease 1 n=1 Tax=Annulohypoxylon maeteangense TaxID=1927788 RepID=UPI0020089BF9|nr:exoribonuclease 1 [Annulohypoxylon maeteangense]KAI0883336.1 exoribonuclease 1 [Annulohypoxylon maeteangense]
MGVPKFFRWLSERYPAISQLIAENRIPEFDNLYLDMNGIIHNCTHKDSHDTSFRLSEDEMFIRIFNYIEHLFGKIKPKKLFFMAIDGVAPRAKMNQQRARRFRTALDAEQAREKAIREGEELPKDDPFDSNCITPGTEFMAKLTQQLKYFINKKISEDSDWQVCDIVLSGHEVPGEGEHKIMEYIRNAKAQPDYHPNVRHCLYGLDADLIMLGLLSHDPHFCLLREEVTFGRASKTKSKELEHQNFYLMHLCIVREYLELEFQELKKEGCIKVPFDMERIIDDFILMAFFVGNDFLPNLPNLHINEGALATMFRLYKQLLPQCDGYINEGGVINLSRLKLLLEELSKEEDRYFENEHADSKWLKGKHLAETNGHEHSKPKGKLVVTSSQKEIWKKIRKFINQRPPTPLDLGHELAAADRKFVQDTADSLHIEWRTVEDGDGQRSLSLAFPAREDGDDNEEEEEEGHMALFRVMKRYDNAQVVDISPQEAQTTAQAMYEDKFQEWKDKYYASKFDWAPEAKETELTKLCENYVQGLQWVLYYYYKGVASWPWFYRYHYSPMTSDITKGMSADLNFKLGQPFRPFEQLMGVLPDRSKKIVPSIYHELMTDVKSPIIDFYPRDFELDMNGKKMEWEAVVKIPFIDEQRLLSAMAPKNQLLTPEERARNDFGVSLKFTYDASVDFIYTSSMVGIFPDVPHCHCVENIFDLPTTEGLDLYVGLLRDTKLGVDALAGFPSLATLPYNATLGFHGVNVFQQESRNESMVVTLADVELRSRAELAKVKLGQKCHVGYPFLQEAKIMCVSDELFDYTLATDGSGQVIQTHHTGREIEEWNKKSFRIENFYSKRLGIIIGTIESMVHVDMLRGLIKTDEGATIKEYGHIPGMETDYAAQVIVDEVISEDERFIERPALPFEEEFPIGSRIFFLGDYAYGRPLEISGHIDNRAEIMLSVPRIKEPDFAHPIIRRAEHHSGYRPSYAVARDLGLHPLVLSKITSSFYVHTIGGSMKVNLGLNLKFEARKQKVLGYSRKSNSGWEFSPTAIQLLVEYMTRFPDFFAAIMKNPSGNELHETQLWPDGDVASARIKEIGAWLKTVETSKFERVPLDAEQLDSDVVMLLQKTVDELRESTDKHDRKKLKGVPRSALLNPKDAEQRLGNQQFSLGDRVVYVQASGKVPIASRGTVVGISTVGNHHMLDILCDNAFMNGTTLGGRCEPFRGQTVSANSVLNVTNRQVIASSKMSLEKRPIQTTLPLQSRGYGTPGDPRGQLRDASAPSPLRGSWRGAVNGVHQQSAQGRNVQSSSAPNDPPRLQHSSMVYRPAINNHQHQQANFQGAAQHGGSFPPRGRGLNRGGRGSRGGRGVSTAPTNTISNPSASGIPGVSQTQAYNAVPPPSGLDVRGGGRGRARGRGALRGRGARGVASKD